MATHPNSTPTTRRAGGIGLEVCKICVDALKARPDAVVFVGSRDLDAGKAAAAELAATDGVRCSIAALQLDVCDDASVQAAAKQVAERLGKGRGLDILVNNAGVLLQKDDNGETEGYNGACERQACDKRHPPHPLTHPHHPPPTTYATAAKGRKTVEVNFEGTVRLTEAMMPLLLAPQDQDNGAHVVNVSSGVGTRTLARLPAEQRAELTDASLTLPALRAFCAAALAELEKDAASPYHAIPTVSYGISKLAVNCYTQMMARRFGGEKENGLEVNAAAAGAAGAAEAAAAATSSAPTRRVRFNAASPGFTGTRMCDGYTGARRPKAPALGASVFRDVLFSDLGEGKNGSFFKQADKAGTLVADARSREEPWVAKGKT